MSSLLVIPQIGLRGENLSANIARVSFLFLHVDSFLVSRGVVGTGKLFPANIADVRLRMVSSFLVKLQLIKFFEFLRTIRAREGSDTTVIDSQMFGLGFTRFLLSALLQGECYRCPCS